MLLEQVLGGAIVVAAYGALWYLVLYSRRIVEKITGIGYQRLPYYAAGSQPGERRQVDELRWKDRQSQRW